MAVGRWGCIGDTVAALAGGIARAKRWSHQLEVLYTDERGAEMAEWAVLTIIVILGSYAVLVSIRDMLGDVFTAVLGQFLSFLD